MQEWKSSYWQECDGLEGVVVVAVSREWVEMDVGTVSSSEDGMFNSELDVGSDTSFSNKWSLSFDVVCCLTRYEPPSSPEWTSTSLCLGEFLNLRNALRTNPVIDRRVVLWSTISWSTRASCELQRSTICPCGTGSSNPDWLSALLYNAVASLGPWEVLARSLVEHSLSESVPIFLLHRGQILRVCVSHTSMQLQWKTCLHGKCRSFSPDAKLSKQIAHVSGSSPNRYFFTGIFLRFRFERRLLFSFLLSTHPRTHSVMRKRAKQNTITTRNGIK